MTDDFFASPSAGRRWEPENRDERIAAARLKHAQRDEALQGAGGMPRVLQAQWERQRWLPAHHPADAILWSEGGRALILNGLACYPGGFDCAVIAVVEPGNAAPEFSLAPMGGFVPRAMLAMMPADIRRRMGIELTEPEGEPFVLALVLPDGARIPMRSILDEMQPRLPGSPKPDSTPDEETRPLVVSSPENGRVSGGMQITVAMADLPDALALEVSWGAQGIGTIRLELDVAAIREASGRAVRISDFGVGDLISFG